MHLLLFSPQGTARIEMDKSSVFALNLQAKDFSITAERSNVAFYSLGGQIDYEANKETLQAIVDRNAFKPSDFIGRETNTWIISDADNYLGSITFDEVSVQDGRVQIAFTFLGGNANWIKNLPEYLHELDLGETFINPEETIRLMNEYTGPYDSTEGLLWFSYKIYNTGLYNSGGDYFTYVESNMRPDLYFKAIIDAMAGRIGLNLVSQIFSSEWFGRWLMPYTGESSLKHHSVTLDTPPSGVLTGFVDTTLWNEAFDPLDLHDAVNIRFRAAGYWPAGSKVYAELQLEWDVASASNAVVYLRNWSQTDYVDKADIVVGQNNIVLKGYFKPLQELSLHINGECELTSGEIRFITSMPRLVEGHYLLNNSPIPEGLKSIDFISELTLMLNLVWYHDAKNYKLIADTKWGGELTTGEVVGGFYKASTFTRNWYNVLDCKNEKSKDLSFGFKEVQWQFKEDDEDNYVTDLLTYGHSEIIKNKGDIKTFKNKIFVPTANIEVPEKYRNNLNSPFTENAILPVMGEPTEIDDPDASEKYNFQPRILFKIGTVDWSLNHTDTLGDVWIAVAFQRIDLRENTNLLDVSPTALVANLGYGDSDGIPGFVSTFYRPDILIWKKGGRKTITLNVNLAEFLSIEDTLRYKKLVGFRDTGIGTYIVESFRLILNKRGLTEVQLIDLGAEKVNL